MRASFGICKAITLAADSFLILVYQSKAIMLRVIIYGNPQLEFTNEAEFGDDRLIDMSQIRTETSGEVQNMSLTLRDNDNYLTNLFKNYSPLLSVCHVYNGDKLLMSGTIYSIKKTVDIVVEVET